MHSIQKIVLFDIDGTLLLTGGAGKAALNRAFERRFGVYNAWGRIIPDGKTDPVIIDEIARSSLKRVLTRKEYMKIVSDYYKLFKEEISRAASFRMMPGIPKLLGRLKSCKELLLGIATGNFQKTSKLKLQKGKVDHFFTFGGYGSDSENRVELTTRAVWRGRKIAGPISSENIFLIGDTPYDIRAGKALGLKTIAVATGSIPASEIKRQNPDYLFANFEKIDSILEVLQG